MAGRILVIRGGAIGDFILTLPAIGLLRESFPEARVEIIGYKHIVSLADSRHYAHGSRSIEYAGMSRLFVPGAEVEEDLRDYLASFQQVLSYIYDPDGLFDGGLRRAGVKNVIHGPARLDDSSHAASQLARPLERLALYLEDPAARLFPNAADKQAAEEFLGAEVPLIAMHPGSGSPSKNWPIEKWTELAQRLLGDDAGAKVLLVGGEADETQLSRLMEVLPPGRVRVAGNLPIPHLAAVLARVALFIGHDSGISHLAAAAGAPCVLLFGPTDPEVWAPRNRLVSIVQKSDGDIAGIEVSEVVERVRFGLRR